MRSALAVTICPSGFKATFDTSPILICSPAYRRVHLDTYVRLQLLFAWYTFTTPGNFRALFSTGQTQKRRLTALYKK